MFSLDFQIGIDSFGKRKWGSRKIFDMSCTLSWRLTAVVIS